MDKLPDTFQNYFTTPSNVHYYSTRSKLQLRFYVPKFRLVRFQKSFKYRGVKIWNSIEQDIKTLPLKKFCKSTKIYCFKGTVFSLKAQLVILLEFKMFFNFSITSKILINFVELFDSKTPQRGLHRSFVDFILFINYFHLSFFERVLLLLAIKSVCLSVLIYSHAQYCISEWGVASTAALEPLEKMHKRVITIVPNHHHHIYLFTK